MAARPYWPSAAERVAKGQTEFFERSEKTKGRADLRAPQHSGGQPRRSRAGRGPQKKKKLDILPKCFLLQLLWNFWAGM